MARIIAHLDCDAFFASVEERDKPRLRGRPLVVGADPENGKGRGVVSTANYKAREYGIRSAMPISEAWRRAEAARRAGKPETVFLEPDFKRYAETSRRIFEIVRHYSPIVEQASVDEAYIDLSSLGTFANAAEICRTMKSEIGEKEKVTVSVGIGPNKLIAKIASDAQKPNGLTVVPEDEAEKFLEPLSIRTIPGVGPKTEQLLAQSGVRAVRDAKRFSREEMERMLGKWGSDLYFKIRGIDDAPLIEEWVSKSIGEQETFHEDTRDANFVLTRLAALSSGVMAQFEREGVSAFRTAVLTVRFSDFTTVSRSHTFREPQSSASILQFEAARLLMPFFDKRENPLRRPIRLIGIRIEKLS